jgi:hypothetical protein
MNERSHATRVLTLRRLQETLLSPGFYIAQVAGLLTGAYLISRFVASVDSSGFDFTLNPVYDLIGRSLSGTFGQAFTAKLFSEGPFLFVLYLAFLPVLIYLAVSSVFRFGLEKKAGAVELLTYGPVDGTACLLSYFAKDFLLTLTYLTVLTVFFAVAAGLNNLVLGPLFFFSLVLLFFIALAVYAYGMLTAVLAPNNPASALAVFIGLIVFFLVLFLGSFTVVSGYVRSLAAVLAWIVQWFSPAFYWSLGFRAMETGNLPFFLLTALLLSLLTAAILAAGHLIIKTRGVKA